MIGADFSAHVGGGNRGDEDVMGRFALQERTQKVTWWETLQSCSNTFIQKRRGQRVTYKSRGRNTQVDRSCPRAEQMECRGLKRGDRCRVRCSVRR